MREGDRVIVLKGSYAGRRGKVKSVRRGKAAILLDRPPPRLIGPALIRSSHLAVTEHGFADFRR